MAKIALVTANFGGIDCGYGLPEHHGIDAFYYTETAGPWRGGWEVVVTNYPGLDFAPRLKAKYFKQQIWRLPEVAYHDWFVWADSSLMFKNLSIVSSMVCYMAYGGHRIALVPHPDRKTVGEEYQFIINRMAAGDEYLKSRYASARMPEQMAEIPPDGRLWCGGFWIMQNSPDTRSFLNDWWDQSIRYGIMDQLPIDMLLKKHGIEPLPIKVNIYDNEYFKWGGHTGGK